MARGKDAAYRDLDRLWGDTILFAVAGEPPARVARDRYGRPADEPGRRVQSTGRWKARRSGGSPCVLQAFGGAACSCADCLRRG